MKIIQQQQTHIIIRNSIFHLINRYALSTGTTRAPPRYRRTFVVAPDDITILDLPLLCNNGRRRRSFRELIIYLKPAG